MRLRNVSPLDAIGSSPMSGNGSAGAEQNSSVDTGNLGQVYSTEVARIASAYDVAMPRLIVTDEADAGLGSFVQLGEDGPELCVSPLIFTAPPPVQREIAAHEMAHVQLGHCGPRRRFRVLVWGFAAAFFGVMIWTAASWPDLQSGQVITINCMLALACFIGIADAISSRRGEYAADRVAAVTYCRPLTGDTVVWLRGHYARSAARWSPSHPSLTSRLRMVGRLG